MKYRLRVKASKKKWATGLVVYDSYVKAKARQEELSKLGIVSVIVDEFGVKLNNK